MIDYMGLKVRHLDSTGCRWDRLTRSRSVMRWQAIATGRANVCLITLAGTA